MVHLLATVILINPAQRGDDWVWWRPPAHVAKSEYLGLSLSEILSMGAKAWGKKIYYLRQSSAAEHPVLFSKDGSTVMWGLCERDRWTQIEARGSISERHAFTTLDHELFLFGMACISLEDTLAGGGTYSTHAPRWMFSDEQTNLASTAAASPEAGSTPIDWRRFEFRVALFAKLRRAPPTILGGNPADLNQMHRMAREARKALIVVKNCCHENKRLPEKFISTFLDDYLFDYLDIRGADQSVVPLQKGHASQPN